MATSGAGLRRLLGTRKKYWLLPLVVVLVLFALLVLASVGSEGDFVYTLD